MTSLRSGEGALESFGTEDHFTSLRPAISGYDRYKALPAGVWRWSRLPTLERS